MKFEWLNDGLKGNHLLCVVQYRSVFFRGTLSSEYNGKRLWRPFPNGDPQEIYGDLLSAQRYCEAMVQEMNEALVADE
jgi:hypothetical protein